MLLNQGVRMTAITKINSVLDIVSSDNVELNLYFITRVNKEGVSAKAKVIDKYSFKTDRIDISGDMQDFFKDTCKKQLNKVLNITDYELEEYSVITDDLKNKLYTYALNNALSFSDVITNQLLQNSVGSVSSLKDIKKNLWAYCIKIEANNEVAFIFRKISAGKVVTDDAQGFFSKISAKFDTNDAELKPVKEESISFDDKLDCIFYNNQFLILAKSGFEQIVGLEEDFLEAANEVITSLQETDLIEGVEHISENLKGSRALLKTLANIGKKGNHSTFDSNEIIKMKDTLKRFENKDLKMSATGRLIIEDKDDVADFIKLLNDYYKQGVVTGKFYGTNSGQVIESNN